MVEFEKKVLLSKREYDFLIYKMSKPLQPQIQTNYYFDTDNFEWNRRGITCRIREKDHQYRATIKAHRSLVGGGSVETERFAENERDDRLFVTMGVKPQGCLITRRIKLLECKEFTVVLDENSYLGCVDHELEIEYDPSFEKQAEFVLCKIADGLANHHLIQSREAFCRRANTDGSKGSSR